MVLPASRANRAPTRRILSSALVAGSVWFVASQDISPATADTATGITEEQPFIAQNAAAMDRMMADMAIKPTGDVDRDFVAMMTPHHQGAVDMAQAELRYGQNEQLRRIAQEIVVEQLQEIAAMHVAVGDRVSPYEKLLAASAPTVAPGSGPSPPAHPAALPAQAEAPFLKDNDTAMTRMMNDMAVKPSGNIDHDFVAMMVPHHQGAIDMAQAELRYGHNAQLRRISQEIIVDQIQEITLMRLAGGEALPSAIASPTDPAPEPRMDSRSSPQMPMQMAPNQTDMK
jgi:uncharacterized protein (DUF305 family)